MSASREKKNRQERAGQPMSAKAKKAQEEKNALRRGTILFGVGTAALLVFVAGLLVWNSGIIQRNAAAVRINGTNYPASDVAYYYYNNKASLKDTRGVDTTTSLRGQEYTTGEGTWFDKEAEDGIATLANTVTIGKAAQDEGFNGGEEVEASVSSAMDSLAEAAASNGYTVSQYLKIVFSSLLTRSDFERNVRRAALAEAYYNSKTDISGYSAEELEAARESDPATYDMVSYESALFYTVEDTGSEEAEDTETAEAEAAETETAESEGAGTDEASETAAAEASEALAERCMERVTQGETLQAAADELGGNYSSGIAYAGTSELSEWLFDEARKDGDSTVLDYYGMGYSVYIFHSRELADYHTVSVRHILVSDEDTAKDLFAQYNAGEKTEAAFAALAAENSTDTGSAESGGLYENVYKGQMVQPFEDWCFDASRASGDTGIVETDYGYHVMYFVETSAYSYWETIAAHQLASEWSGSITADIQTEQLDGMKYVDP